LEGKKVWDGDIAQVDEQKFLKNRLAKRAFMGGKKREGSYGGDSIPVEVFHPRAKAAPSHFPCGGKGKTLPPPTKSPVLREKIARGIYT